MGNIILNEELHISATKLQEVNDIESLSFYVSKKYANSNICIAITDSRGIFDIIPLTFLKAETNYKVYHIDCKNKLRIQSGQCKITFFVFDKEFENCCASNTFSLDLSVENYNLFRQTYINRELCNEIAITYEKILKMTEINIEIYDKMRGVKNDEN